MSDVSVCLNQTVAPAASLAVAPHPRPHRGQRPPWIGREPDRRTFLVVVDPKRISDRPGSLDRPEEPPRVRGRPPAHDDGDVGIRGRRAPPPVVVVDAVWPWQ